MLTIEFFHDVICSFCFPMSYRMRQLVKNYPMIEIKHRSFALAWDEEAMARMFGSHEAAKDEVLSHWVHANQNDDQHRFNIKGMKDTDFLFPTSKPGLITAKAAELTGGTSAYWDAFDRLQHGLFVENKNVGDSQVISEFMRELDIDFDQWEEHFYHSATEEAVLEDILLARQYGINAAPSLVINGKYLISGAQSYQQIETLINQIAEREGLDLKKVPTLETINEAGPECTVENGQWNCD